jgi:hypothetical protein
MRNNRGSNPSLKRLEKPKFIEGYRPEFFASGGFDREFASKIDRNLIYCPVSDNIDRPDEAEKDADKDLVWGRDSGSGRTRRPKIQTTRGIRNAQRDRSYGS